MNKLSLYSSLIFMGLLSINTYAQQLFSKEYVQPRARVIIDNDFSGDPDGLFQLAHQLLCQSTEIRAIIGSHLTEYSGFNNGENTAKAACQKANEILDILNMKGQIPVLEGSAVGMTDPTQFCDSEGARFIVQEALRTDVNTPLYVVCGAGLTNIASAWLINPEISKHLTLVWIGGQEHQSLAVPPPGYDRVEYNLNLCIPAGRTIFNLSDIPIWQVPRNAYRQCNFSYAELLMDVKPLGELGAYLTESLERLMKDMLTYNANLGETYILGDNPLVLLTSLQSNWQPDSSSCSYAALPAPYIEEDGSYQYRHQGRMMRVYNQLDIRLMFSDMIAKFKLLNSH